MIINLRTNYAANKGSSTLPLSTMRVHDAPDASALRHLNHSHEPDHTQIHLTAFKNYFELGEAPAKRKG